MLSLSRQCQNYINFWDKLLVFDQELPAVVGSLLHTLISELALGIHLEVQEEVQEFSYLNKRHGSQTM